MNGFYQQPASPDQDMFMTSGLGTDAFGHTQASNNFQVEIVALYLQETGTYNDMYQRDYVAADPDGMSNTLVNTLAQNRMASRGNAMANIASNIIDLDGRNTTAVVVPNGWGERRFRFILQTRERSMQFPGVTYYTYVQGFSEAMDISLQSSAINPDMNFFINSFLRIKEHTVQSAEGPKLVHRVQQQGQMLNGVLVSHQNPHGQTHFMRPMDIFGRVQVMNDAELRAGDVYDLRGTSTAGCQSVLNSYSNNTPTTYLSRLITPMVDGLKQVNYGTSVGNLVDNVVGNAMAFEPTIQTSPLLSLLERQIGRPGGSMFTMNELAMIDPTVGTRTHVRQVSQQYRGGLSQRGVSADWNDSLPETMLATKLLNSIPGVLWQNYIGSISFSVTNALGSNRVETKVDRVSSFTVYSPPEAISAFYHDLEETIARDISYNHQISFSASINVSVLDDIHINVSVNGSPYRYYVAPCFTSGILNPVYTHNGQNFERFANAMFSVNEGLQVVAREADAAAMINTNI